MRAVQIKRELLTCPPWRRQTEKHGHQARQLRNVPCTRNKSTQTMTHIHTQPFNGRWSGTTRVGRYEKKLTHSHPSWSTHILYQLPPFTTSLRAWQSSMITSLRVLFGLPLGLGPSTSYSMHFYTQSSSSFFAAHAHTNAACSAVIRMLWKQRLRDESKTGTIL